MASMDILQIAACMENAQECKKNIFYEAKCHCRHKTKLELFLKTINLETFKNKSFEQLFLELPRLKGSIGNLTIYDIASDITRVHGRIIQKVYIIGDGPKRAIKLLGLKKQKDKKIGLTYVTCKQVVNALKLEPCDDGDLLETLLCQWQKTCV